MRAASRPAPPAPPMPLARISRSSPARSITPAWRMSATVVPQAPPSTRARARSGADRRLGVQGDGDALLPGIGQEQVAVGAEGGLVQRQHRERHAPIRGVPAQERQVRGGEIRGARRHAAQAVVEQHRPG